MELGVYTFAELTPEVEGGPTVTAERRLRDLIQARPASLLETVDGRLVLTLPLRRPDPIAPDGMRVLGSLEVGRPLAELDASLSSDVLHTLPLLAFIVGLVLALLLLVPRPNKIPVRSLDLAAAAGQARAELGFAPANPTMPRALPDTSPALRRR